MAKCIKCGKPGPVKSAVVDGKFGGYCPECLNLAVRLQNPGLAQYSRDRDIDAHAKDILTPWTRRGIPSKEFIRNYPEEAKEIFSKEELENYG